MEINEKLVGEVKKNATHIITDLRDEDITKTYVCRCGLIVGTVTIPRCYSCTQNAIF